MPTRRGSTSRCLGAGVMLVAVACGAAVADTIHVPGDYGAIQDAIDAALDGDEICVAPGTYNETIDFLGKSVRLYGRDGPEVTSIDATGHDASVVQCVTGEGPDAILDGFTITGGTGTWREEPWPARYGGGMLNVGSSPTVTDCTFTGNAVDWAGGGMANADSRPLVTNCSFVANEAYDGGGGMWNDHSSPTVTNCLFGENVARDGGGMSNWNESRPEVTDCSFTGNRADNRGGGMSSWFDSHATTTSCAFTRNTAGNRAGGMYNGFSDVTVINCTFTENTSNGRGGGMYNYGSDSILAGCTFTANAARFSRGGGMYNFYSGPTVTSCSFIDNVAESDRGGAMCDEHSRTVMTSCTFSGNDGIRGGAIYVWRSHPTLTNCAFIGNTADSRGGAIFIFAGEPTVTSCTFIANVAADGRSIACDTPDWERASAVRVANCVLWNGGREVSNDDASTIVIAYSDVQGGYPGRGNVEVDPRCDAAGRLRPGSPCIDAAANNAVLADALDLDGDGITLERLPVDRDGNPRFTNDAETPDTGCGSVVVDMGAFEFPGAPGPPMPIGDVDGDGTAGFDDLLGVLGAWGACDAECCLADVDFTSEVGFEDLLLVLASWSESP